MMKKSNTPFLDSVDMDIKSTYSAPLPDIRDLPRSVVYSFDVFPKLSPSLFGEPRAPRQLFTEVETGRTVKVPTNSQRVQIDDETGLLAPYTLNGNGRKTVDFNTANNGVIKIQALYRMWIAKKKYRLKKEKIRVVVRFFRSCKEKTKWRAKRTLRRMCAIKIQTRFRIILAKKLVKLTQKRIVLIQSVMR